MNINDDSSVETLDSDLGISAAFMSIAESATDRGRAQSAFKAAVKHYNEAAQTFASILDATGSRRVTGRCRARARAQHPGTRDRVARGSEGAAIVLDAYGMTCDAVS